MARNIPARLLHGGDHFGIAFQRGRDAEHGGRQLAFAEHPPQPPEAGARAIFEHRLDIGMAPSGPWLRAQHVGQERFRRAVAMQDVVLAAFLEIHHELHRDPRAARPMRIGRIAAVAAEIAWIARVRHRQTISKRIFWAPSQSTVLPSKGRFSRPDVTVMKWLPASWPIL